MSKKHPSLTRTEEKIAQFTAIELAEGRTSSNEIISNLSADVALAALEYAEPLLSGKIAEAQQALTQAQAKKDAKTIDVLTTYLLNHTVSLNDIYNSAPKHIAQAVTDNAIKCLKDQIIETQKNIALEKEQQQIKAQETAFGFIKKLVVQRETEEELNKLSENNRRKERVNFLQNLSLFCLLPTTENAMKHLEQQADGSQIPLTISPNAQEAHKRIQKEISAIQREIKPVAKNRKRNPIIKAVRELFLARQ